MRLKEWTMEEQEPLIHFLTTSVWPYHVNTHPGRELIEKAIEEGGYESDDVKTFWIETDESEKLGVVQIYDMQDEIPVFDLRIAENYREKGYGLQALRLLTEYIFSLEEPKIRLEGHTRQDNIAMRKTFERVGFVKEAHFRKAWYVPKEDEYYDAITYGITREDFIEGKTTPVSWEDEKVRRPNPAINWDFESSFESERLIIRMPELADAEAVYEAMCRSAKSLKPHMIWAQQKPVQEQVRENIRQAQAAFLAREDLRLHLFLKETGEFVGSSGLHRIDWTIPKFEIGYWVDDKFEGKGYMTEATNRIATFAFKELAAKRIEIRCDRDNVRSRAVAERSGFELEGILRNDRLAADGLELRDTCIYSKIKE
ncbi:MAG: GNAT family N-acetyltransferase [Kurthia sp.]|nr:GNAT family N-acetyltransferase [Candidatus Kurthia equi]